MEAPDHPRKISRGDDDYWVISDSTPKECAYLCDSNPECKAFEFGHDYGASRNVFYQNDCLLNSNDEVEACSSWNLDVYRESLSANLYCCLKINQTIII